MRPSSLGKVCSVCLAAFAGVLVLVLPIDLSRASEHLEDGCASVAATSTSPAPAVRTDFSSGEWAGTIARVQDDGHVTISTRVISRMARPLTVEVGASLLDSAGRPLGFASRSYRLAAASRRPTRAGCVHVRADALQLVLAESQYADLARIVVCQRRLGARDAIVPTGPPRR